MHAWLSDAVAPLALAHMAATGLFALLHVPSMHATWRLRRERDPARVGALLDRSRKASAASSIALILLAASGAALASATHAWREPWVWGSALVLVALSLAMSLLAARPFNEAREALGLRWFDGRRVRTPAPADLAALEGALAGVRARAGAVILVGVGGFALLFWLMLARPG